MPYAFYVDGAELSGEIGAAMVAQSISVEKVVDILYRPQAVFRVRPVGRCSATMAGAQSSRLCDGSAAFDHARAFVQIALALGIVRRMWLHLSLYQGLTYVAGHKEAVLSAHFSPDGRRLATGSGDATVQFWDLSTQLRARAGVAHATWVMVVAWAPDAGTLVSGDKAGVIHVWDAEGGDKSRGACKGHSKWITALAWRPAHLQLPATRFVSASKDGTVRVWEASSRQQLLCLGGHSATVNAVVWSGDDTIISGSNDREIRVWNAEDGRTIRVLHGHAHWVNALALSCAHVLRTGAYDHAGQRHASDAAAQAAARKRYDEATGGQPERLVSASDDHTLFLWTPMRRQEADLPPHGPPAAGEPRRVLAGRPLAAVRVVRQVGARVGRQNRQVCGDAAWPCGACVPCELVFGQPHVCEREQGQHAEGVGPADEEAEGGAAGARGRGVCGGLESGRRDGGFRGQR